MAKPVLLYSRFDDGHRAAFVEFFTSLLPGRRARASELLLSQAPVLFLMIEEAFALYMAVALFRAAIGRRTVGFLFRPGPALQAANLRTRLKQQVLRWLRRVPSCRTLTILPFEVEPRFAEIADDGIDDPQQWDLADADLDAATQLRRNPAGLGAKVIEAARGRRVVAALGRLDRAKGFDQMVASYVADQGLRQNWLFVAGGKVAESAGAGVAEFVSAGGLLFDERLSDGEMLELYAAADLIWCCYAPDYDQSSGIMGRAAQLGIPVLVRRGSLLERICVGSGIDHVAGEAVPQALESVAVNAGRGRKQRDLMRTRSLVRLRTALYGRKLVSVNGSD